MHRDQYYWRSMRDHLMTLAAFYVNTGTIEYQNLHKRIQWIWANRISPAFDSMAKEVVK